MKKSMYMVIAVVIIVCTIMLPTSVFAKDYAKAVDFELTTINGESTTIKSLSGKSIILIFGRMGEMLCGNTYGTVTNINSVLSKSNHDSLCAYYLDIEEANSKEAISKNMVSMSNITTCYKPSNYNEQSWDLYYKYKRNNTGSASVYLPMIFFINSKGEICDYSEGGLSTEECIDKIDENFDIDIDINSKGDNASGSCGEGVTWTFEKNGTLTIKGNGEMYWPGGYSVGIPWGDYINDIENVVIEDGVTAITDCAFYGCGNLKSIDIPESVNRIGSFAFAECSSLEQITIPVGVTQIEGWTFRNCSSLQNMYIPSSVTSIGPVAFLNSPNGFNVYYGGTATMWGNIDMADNYIENDNPNIYFNCKSIGSVTISMKIGSRDAIISGKNKTCDVSPVIVNDRTMLPARFVVEALGAKIAWIENERKVEISNDNTEIFIYIDSDKAIVNSEEKNLDSPAFIKNGRTYIPIRFISETLGAKVEWTQASQEVTIINE